MTGPQHFAEAQKLLETDCEYGCPHTGCEHEQAHLARAQVHATLAHAAASLFPYHDEKPGEAEWKEWRDAMTAG